MVITFPDLSSFLKTFVKARKFKKYKLILLPIHCRDRSKNCLYKKTSIEELWEFFCNFAGMNGITADTDSHTGENAVSLRMGKGEKLRHKRLVDRLFAEGASVYAYPLRAVWLMGSAEDTVEAFRSRHIPSSGTPVERLSAMRIDALQFLVSVPKRKHRHAVDRVWLRRRIREAWRLQRSGLRDMLRRSGQTMSVAIVYTDSRRLDYAAIAARVGRILARLEREAAAAASGSLTDGDGEIKTSEA